VNIFGDSIDTMELEVIKEKISSLYNSILEKYYKKQNPGATEDEILDFMESNALEFESTEEEVDELDELMLMLDGLMDDGEDLEPVDSSGNVPDYKGSTVGAKSNEKNKTPSGVYAGDISGGMMTPSDVEVKVKTTKEKDPKGGINRKQLDEVVVQYSELVEKLKEELASLKQRRRIGVKEFRLG